MPGGIADSFVLINRDISICFYSIVTVALVATLFCGSVTLTMPSVP